MRGSTSVAWAVDIPGERSDADGSVVLGEGWGVGGDYDDADGGHREQECTHKGPSGLVPALLFHNHPSASCPATLTVQARLSLMRHSLTVA